VNIVSLKGEEMDRQKIFNEVRAHALKQQKRAIRDYDGTCMYRAPNGLKCFIGAVFPDEIYKPEMECMGIHALVRDYPEIHEFFEVEREEDTQFLSNLQCIHDSVIVEQWEENLKDFAKRYGLEVADDSSQV